VWELVSLPKAKKPINIRWVFKIKFHLAGIVVKYNATLIVHEFLQRHEVDYKQVLH